MEMFGPYELRFRVVAYRPHAYDLLVAFTPQKDR